MSVTGKMGSLHFQLSFLEAASHTKQQKQFLTTTKTHSNSNLCYGLTDFLNLPSMTLLTIKYKLLY
jgi:hypothetical protein